MALHIIKISDTHYQLIDGKSKEVVDEAPTLLDIKNLKNMY